MTVSVARKFGTGGSAVHKYKMIKLPPPSHTHTPLQNNNNNNNNLPHLPSNIPQGSTLLALRYWRATIRPGSSVWAHTCLPQWNWDTLKQDWNSWQWTRTSWEERLPCWEWTGCEPVGGGGGLQLLPLLSHPANCFSPASNSQTWWLLLCRVSDWTPTLSSCYHCWTSSWRTSSWRTASSLSTWTVRELMNRAL